VGSNFDQQTVSRIHHAHSIWRLASKRAFARQSTICTWTSTDTAVLLENLPSFHGSSTRGTINMNG